MPNVEEDQIDIENQALQQARAEAVQDAATGVLLDLVANISARNSEVQSMSELSEEWMPLINDVNQALDPGEQPHRRLVSQVNAEVASAIDALAGLTAVQNEVNQMFTTSVSVSGLDADIPVNETPPSVQMFDPIDNIPEQYRSAYMTIHELAVAHPNRTIAGEVMRHVNDAITGNPQGEINMRIDQYMQYVQTVLTSSHPSKLDKEDRKQERANLPDARAKLSAPMGFEFSYHPPLKKKKKGSSPLDELLEGISTINIGDTSLSGVGLIRSGTSGTSLISDLYVPVPCDGSEPDATPEQGSEQPSEQDDAEQESNMTESNMTEEQAINIVAAHGSILSESDIQDTVNRIESVSNDINDIYQSNIPQTTGCSCRPGGGCDICQRTGLDPLSSLKDELEKLMIDEGLLKGFGARIYVDGADLIEVCSPVLKSRAAMLRWFEKTDAIAKGRGHKPWKRKAKGGGGLHVNISYNKTLPHWKLGYINFFIMVANYPEINWIFNEPSDDHTAKALVRDERFVRAMHELKKGESTVDEAWADMHVCGGKSVAINGKDDWHFELRTFEMSRSVADFMDVVDFVDGLLLLCMEVASWDVVIPLEMEIPAVHFEGAEERGYILDTDEKCMVFPEKMWSGDADFNELLGWLGLDTGRYTKYRRRNYHARRGAPYGKKYFT